MIVTTVIAALAAVTVNAAPTPIEPIDPAAVAIAQTLPAGEEVCVGYGQIMDGFMVLAEGDLESYFFLQEMFDSWSIDQVEEGWGPNARMTDEARDDFVDWLHSCA